MKSKYYKIFLNLLLIIGVIFFCTFIISSILIFYFEPNLSLRFDSNGFLNFFQIFSPSIKIGTATIVILTLWLTLKRMEQTQEQLFINQENINFNNFYKHKEEFSKFLYKISFFNYLKEQSKIDIEKLIPAIYAYFFNDTYISFKPYLNSNSKKEIFDFISSVKNSKISLEGYNLKDVEIEELKNISKNINRTVDPICKINTEIEVKKMRISILNSGGKAIKLVEERLRLLDSIYVAITLYETFLAFDGIHQAERGMFTLNYFNYLKSYNLLTA